MYWELDELVARAVAGMLGAQSTSTDLRAQQLHGSSPANNGVMFVRQGRAA